MVDTKKNKYMPIGNGTITLSSENFVIEGQLHGESVSLTFPISSFPTLPFSMKAFRNLEW